MNISEVSQKYNLSKDTLRYYEKVGLLKPIAKNKSGMRDYSDEDCVRIELIIFYRAAGLSIEKLKRYLKLFDKGDEVLEQRKEILVEHAKYLEEQGKTIKHSLDIIKQKIKKYDEEIEKYNKKNK